MIAVLHKLQQGKDAGSLFMRARALKPWQGSSMLLYFAGGSQETDLT